MIMAKGKFSLEDAFQELDGILEALEQPDIRLAESMDLYKKGVKLLDKCRQTIDRTEKEIIVLQEGRDGDFVGDQDTGEDRQD